MRRRTYQAIPKEGDVALSTVTEEGAQRSAGTRRKFIVKTFKEEGNEPMSTKPKQSDAGDYTEQFPLLPNS